MTDVIVTNEFTAWYQELSEGESDAVFRVIDLLEVSGVKLGYPHSSAIKGADWPLRELRPKAGRSPIRIFYAFDPRRAAVLLIGGDKSGDNRFYKSIIPHAERLWRVYLQETNQD